MGLCIGGCVYGWVNVACMRLGVVCVCNKGVCMAEQCSGVRTTSDTRSPN